VIDSASDILSAWQNQQPTFELWTSGSTGDPSSVSHSREALTWSANSTLQSWFNPEKPPIQLCALPLNKAGGFMQVIRAAVWQTSFTPNQSAVAPGSGDVIFIQSKNTWL